MLKNKIHFNVTVILFLFIYGCGTMVKEENQPSISKVSVPEKVSIPMPKALEINASKTEIHNDNNKSIGYIELKDDIEFLEEQRKSLEINLLFINQVINDIVKECQKVKKEDICIIKENTLSFIFDQNLSDKIKNLTSEEFFYEIGENLSFGEIEFIEHNTTSIYAYTLGMDTSFEDEETNSFESISWSKDNRLILSKYFEENSTEENDIIIDFTINEDESKIIIVEDNWWSKEDNSSDSFQLEMFKNIDSNETYELNSISISIDSNGIKNSFTSVGELFNSGGYLNFVGEFNGEIFKENDIFDAQGNILSSIYCYSNMDCNLEDEDSWFTD